MTERECSIDGCGFTTHSPIGSPTHARKHRHEFEQLVGREPKDFDEVRRLFNTDWRPEDYDGARGRPTTLDAFGGDDE